MTKSIHLSVAFALTLLAIPAHSGIIYALDQDNCTNGCGAAGLRQVSLEQTTSTLVTVVVTLNPGDIFASTGAGEALEFNVPGPITIAGISAGFGPGPANDTAAGFGTFLESIHCTACKGGKPTNPSGPFSFTITSPTGVLVSDFATSTKGYYFSVNLVGGNGNGGNVAAIAPVAGGGSAATSTPEPLSVSLIGLGLLVIGVSRRFGPGKA